MAAVAILFYFSINWIFEFLCLLDECISFIALVAAIIMGIFGFAMFVFILYNRYIADISDALAEPPGVWLPEPEHSDDPMP